MPVQWTAHIVQAMQRHGGSIKPEVEAAHPTPMSMWRELVADSHGFATAMLDVHSKMVKPA